MAMYRMQLLLKPEQRKRLERVARRAGRTFSETARRALDEGLRVMEGESDSLWEQRLAAMESLNQMRKQIQERHGVYQHDLVNEGRAEQESRAEQIWRSQ